MGSKRSGPLQGGISGLNQPKRFSLAETIADTVAGAIASGQLNAGDRVVELALAEQMGASRVPVREALKVLHAQGIITGGSHRGFRVATFDEGTANNVFEVRLMLEKILLRDAIKRIRAGEANLDGAKDALQGMQNAARIEDRAASLAADLDFHRAISQASGNEIAETLWETLARHVLIIFSRKEYRDDDLDTIVTQHIEYLAFIERCLENPPDDSTLEDALSHHLLQVARARKQQSSDGQG